MHTRLFALLLASALAALCRADGPTACGYTSNGETINVQPLMVGSGGDYTSIPDSSGYVYEMNVCAASTTSITNCQQEQAAICQSKSGNFVATVAKWPSSGTPTGWSLINGDIKNGIELQFGNGDNCYPVGAPRTSRIQFVCSTQRVGTISVTSTGCDYTVNFPTSLACVSGSNPGGGGGDGSGKLSGGWVFVIILLVTSFVYVVGGCAYNHYKHKDEGWSWKQKCPNITFWATCPGLIKDGCMFSWVGVKGLISRARGGAGEPGEPYYNQM